MIFIEAKKDGFVKPIFPQNGDLSASRRRDAISPQEQKYDRGSSGLAKIKGNYYPIAL